ncbi:MAG: hypothetical protein II922_00670 [Succinimonas sp.]|nr:hypothetical protein [Succinimonas sp.]
MMIRAYPEMYLPKAQAVLGEVLDYAVNSCGMSGEGFINMFIESSVSKRMAVGEPALVAGKSGIEIVLDTVFEATGKILDIPPEGELFQISGVLDRLGCCLVSVVFREKLRRDFSGDFIYGSREHVRHSS